MDEKDATSDEDNRCVSCGDIMTDNKPLEKLNDGRMVHRACFLEGYKWLKLKGLVGSNDKQVKLL